MTNSLQVTAGRVPNETPRNKAQFYLRDNTLYIKIYCGNNIASELNIIDKPATAEHVNFYREEYKAFVEKNKEELPQPRPVFEQLTPLQVFQRDQANIAAFKARKNAEIEETIRNRNNPIKLKALTDLEIKAIAQRNAAAAQVSKNNQQPLDKNGHVGPAKFDSQQALINARGIQQIKRPNQPEAKPTAVINKPVEPPQVVDPRTGMYVRQAPPKMVADPVTGMYKYET